jgi:hypothetical protein
MGEWRPRDIHARGDGGRASARHRARAQRLWAAPPPPPRRPGHQRVEAVVDRKPHGVHRAKRLAVGSGGDATCRAVGTNGSRIGPVRGDPNCPSRSIRARSVEVVFTLAVAGSVEEAESLSGRFCTLDGAAQALDAVHTHWNRVLGSRASRNARSRARCSGEWLADLPNIVVPRLGPKRVLPVRRRLRLQGPAAGHHGAGARRPRFGARSDHPLRRSAVHAGRRSALVAPARRPRCPHALFRRFPLASPTRRAAT